MIRSLAGSIYVFFGTMLFFEWYYQINGMDLFSLHYTLNCFHSFNCALYGHVKLGRLVRTKAGGWKMPTIKQGGWGWGKGKWWFAIDEEKSTSLWVEKA